VKRVAVSVRPETKNSLEEAATIERSPDVDAFLVELSANYRLAKLRKWSRLLRRRMRERGLTLDDLLKGAESRREHAFELGDNFRVL
jgi:hypothetical protein